MTQLNYPIWLNHDETSSELEMGQFLYGMVRMIKPKLLVETGSYCGLTTCHLARAIKENNYGKFISCDTNAEYLIHTARHLYQHNLYNFVELKCIASHLLPELTEADMIYSDSDYACRETEIKLAKTGCIIVVHDTSVESWKRYGSTSNYLGDIVKHYDGILFDVSRGFSIIKK